MKSALVFSLAFFLANISFATFSEWNLVKKSSSPDFADLTFQGNSDTSESLQIMAFKRVDDVLNLEKKLLASFKGNIEERIQDDPGYHFLVRDLRVTSPESNLPPAIIVTAIEKGDFPRYFGMQFIIKPHCEKCLLRVEEVKRQFSKARFNEAGTEIFFAGRSFDITDLAFTPIPGYFDSMFSDLKTTFITFGVTAAGLAFYAFKTCGGLMGFNGPCGSNLAACQCGNALVRGT